MRRPFLLVLACGVLATACDDKPTNPSRPSAAFELVGPFSGCVSADSVEALISAFFPAGKDRSSALARFRQVRRLVGPTPPGPDTASAVAHALNLVEFILKKYRDGRLIGGTSPETQAATVDMLNGVLCTVGLAPAFGPGTLGEDGAAEVISPTSPTTVVLTESEQAGVEVPAGAVEQTVLVTVTRLPDVPGPLLTELDQYPPFYEFTVTPEGAFAELVVVGACVQDAPDPTRLRLAHNVPPFTPGSIEILPLVPAPFLNCEAGQAAAPGENRWLARRGWLYRALAALAPRPLYAATFGTTGLGGTVRSFSPFGAVDTLGVMTAASALIQDGVFGQPVSDPPSVLITTPTGQPMEGVSVTFAVTAGGGSVSGANAVTDASGRATVGGWTLGLVHVNSLAATATAPHAGSGISGSPIVFTANAREH
jgi:hypothetical protein